MHISEKKDDLIWDTKSKVFAIYDDDFGLVFSKKPRNKRLASRWMKTYGERELKILGEGDFVNFSSKKFKKVYCDSKKCEVDILRDGVVEKVLILLRRNKIEDMCKATHSRIIILNKRYLPYACHQ